MFTGIIESQGKIIRLEHSKSNIELFIESPLRSDLHIDQSLAHDGVCLTVDQLGPDWHRCTVIHETLTKTNLGTRKPGDLINLERAMKFDSRLEGHIVQGHTDVPAQCVNVLDQQGSWVFEFALPQEFNSMIILKGSIAINGVSLTVSGLTTDTFQVSIIPYTYSNTNFQFIKKGDLVNIELDMIGKYIQRRIDLNLPQGLR